MTGDGPCLGESLLFGPLGLVTGALVLLPIVLLAGWDNLPERPLLAGSLAALALLVASWVRDWWWGRR